MNRRTVLWTALFCLAGAAAWAGGSFSISFGASSHTSSHSSSFHSIGSGFHSQRHSTVIVVSPYISPSTCYPHGSPYHICATPCPHYYSTYPVSYYEHGHRQHACDRSCRHYRSNVRYYPHGHSLHVCAAGCYRFIEPTVVYYPHGHRYHACDYGCSHYYPHRTYFYHGHARHVCTSSCTYFSPARIYAHGHHLHDCRSGCPFFRQPILYYHGHALHQCTPSCSQYRERHATPRYESISPRERQRYERQTQSGTVIQRESNTLRTYTPGRDTPTALREPEERIRSSAVEVHPAFRVSDMNLRSTDDRYGSGVTRYETRTRYEY